MLPQRTVRSGIPCLLLLCCALSGRAGQQPTGPAQTLVLDGLGKGSATLDGLWKFHLGDDPAWAQPSCNDTGWNSILADSPWGAQGYPSYSGFAWYRRHIDIIPAPGTSSQYEVLIPHGEDAYEVYWNGKLMGSYGKLPPHPWWYYSVFPRSFPIQGPTTGILAIRVWRAPMYIFSSADDGGIYLPPIVGDPDTIALYESEINWSSIQLQLFEYAVLLLRVFIAALCVVLWSRNRSEQLFVWVGAYTAAPVALETVQGLFLIPFTYGVGRLINQPLYALSNIALWFVLIWLLQLNERRWVMRWTKTLAWLTFAAGIADGVLSLFWGSATLSMQWANGLLTAFMLLAEIFPMALVAIGLRHKLDVSRWAVALTAFVLQMLHTLADASAFGQRFTHLALFTALVDTPLFTIQGIGFQFEKIMSLALFASIIFAVYRYILEQQARRVALEQEMQSAREIQQVLIPETLPSLEGYAITSAYTPAQEVGGDFFQILAGPDGSTIVALGDVSGKGLKAAMNVSMIVGVMRAEAANTTSPREILTALNRCLAGRMQGGFATGLVFRLDPDGTVVFANAGHLPPYLNGLEFLLEPSLPLGLVSQADYSELKVRLHPGDQLSFYTDGLLEARNASGELYGFERLNALFAGRPTAQQASETAVAFGQEDDITVLTLTRLAAGEESSTSLVTPVLENVSARA